MADEKYRALLSELPSIAKAVNQFSAEATQVIALQSVLATFGLPTSSIQAEGEKPPQHPSTGNKLARKSGPTKTKAASGTKKKASASKLQTVKDLDLWPKGEKSLSDYLAEKRPKGQPEEVAVIVYYLKNILNIASVSQDHVFTCFKALRELRIPGNTSQTLRNTASRHTWIDVSDMEDIHLTPAGENYVEHELPPEQS